MSHSSVSTLTTKDTFEWEPSFLLHCSNLSLIYCRFRVNPRQNKLCSCNMFCSLTSSLFSSTSTHLSPVQLENINLQQLAHFCFSFLILSLSCTTFILGTCQGKDTAKQKTKISWYFRTNIPHTELTSKSAFPTNIWTQRESSLSQTVGVCLRCRGQIPPSLLHEKRAARQWGVSSTITTQLDAWQMKMRQQEDQNCCIICVSNISHPACISQDGSNEIDQVNTQSQYTLQSEHSLRTIPGIVNSSLFSESLMHRFSSLAYGKSYPSAPREFKNTINMFWVQLINPAKEIKTRSWQWKHI